MDKSTTLALTTAATKSTPTTTATTTLTTTLTSTPTTTISSTSSSRAPTKPETEMETTTEFGATNSSDRNVTPSMVKAEANIDRTGSTIVAAVVPVLILALVAATVFVVCKKSKDICVTTLLKYWIYLFFPGSQHIQEKTDTEKMMPEDEKLSDVSHEVDVDRCVTNFKSFNIIVNMFLFSAPSGRRSMRRRISSPTPASGTVRPLGHLSAPPRCEAGGGQ